MTIRSILILLSSLLTYSVALCHDYEVINYSGTVEFKERNTIVPLNQIWIFKAGTKVTLPPGGKITVRGILRTSGHDNAKVIIESRSGYWKGITFLGDIEKVERLAEFSTLFPTALSFIRHTELKGIGSESGMPASAITLQNHSGLFVKGLHIDESTNYIVANIVNSELYLYDSSFGKGLSYPIVNSYNSVFLGKNIKNSVDELSGVNFSFSNSIASLDSVDLMGNGILVDANKSKILLINSKATSAATPLFLSNSILLGEGVTYQTGKGRCPVAQSHNSFYVDPMASDICMSIWVELEFIDETLSKKALKKINGLVLKYIFKNGKRITAKDYHKWSMSCLQSKLCRMKFTDSKLDFEASQFFHIADKYFLEEWLKTDPQFQYRKGNPFASHKRRMRAYFSASTMNSYKSPDLDTLPGQFVYRATQELNTSNNHCILKKKQWMKSKKDIFPQLYPSRFSATGFIPNQDCSDMNDSFSPIKEFQSKIGRVYSTIVPQYL